MESREAEGIEFLPVGKVHPTPRQEMERRIRWLEREVLVLMVLCIAVIADALVTVVLLEQMLRMAGVF